MALGGIAIAIGTMVDIAIVFIENIEQHLTDAVSDQDREVATRRAAAEVAPAVLTSVLTTIVSFLPVFGLTATELRLFAPLAYTKTFAMSVALLLSILVLPGAALIVLRRRPEALVKQATGLSRVWHSVRRAAHLRDWLLVGLGVAALPTTIAGGLLVIALGGFRLARPLLSAEITARWTAVEAAVTVLVVTALLASDWMPLGHGNGVVLNVLFVGLIIAVVLGGFRLFESVYGRILAVVLERKTSFLLLPLALVLFGSTAWLGFDTVFGFVPRVLRASAPVSAVADALPGFGREYMPPFDEGSYLYMPTTMPHASAGEALGMLSAMDAAIAQIPEVDRVVGKLGRADSALDPAPISMIETIITYKPEYRIEPDGTRVRQWRDHIVTARDIWTEITAAAEMPGVTSAPVLMPINARIVMLQSGMRAPMGIKVKGPSLEAIEAFGFALEDVLREVPSIRQETVFADRVVGKPYLEIDIDREAIGRYGLAIVDVQQVLQVA